MYDVCFLRLQTESCDVQEPASTTLFTGVIFKPFTATLYCQEGYIFS